jgi:outer membrane receptor for ferrienterochelin and colicins
VPRWVSRPRNVGGATTRGVELEAKFRLDEMIDQGPPLYVNSNLSIFDSSVEGVPGPNNFIDSQPRATANLGVEYRMRSAPLRLGANVNWTPGRTVQRSDIQEFTTDRKLITDAFVLWLIDANTRLRVSASNLAPGDFVTGSTIVADAQRQTSINGGDTFTTFGVRLEMKL